MRRNATALTIVAALVLLLAPACALSGLFSSEPPPPPTPSRTPQPTFTPTPVVEETPPLAPTMTPTQEVRPTPTSAPAEPQAPETPPAPDEPPTPEPPTDTPVPQTAQVIIDNPTLNVRQGPGTNYAIIGRVNNGERYDIRGKNQPGTWWQINFNGRDGWVSGDFVRTEGEVGGVQVAANIPPPPPPPTRPPATPTPPPPPAQPTQPPAPQYPFTLLQGVESCAPNAGTTYFTGFARYPDNNPRNGVCIHIAYYGPRQTVCTGCDGVGAGIFSFSPFGGPAPPGTPVEIFVVPCPPNMPSGGQNQGTGFGDLTPQSEKWTRTINQSEQCTGITFVGN